MSIPFTDREAGRDFSDEKTPPKTAWVGSHDAERSRRVARDRATSAGEGSPLELRQPVIPPSETSSVRRHVVRTDATLPKRSIRRWRLGSGQPPRRSSPDSGAVTRHGFRIGVGGRATSCFPAFGVFIGGSRRRSRTSASPKVSRCQLPRPRHRKVLDQDRGHAADLCRRDRRRHRVSGTYKITKFAMEKASWWPREPSPAPLGGSDDTVKKAVTIPTCKAPAAGRCSGCRRCPGARHVPDPQSGTLGPLDLNLLNLRVQLNQVDLDLTAATKASGPAPMFCGEGSAHSPTWALNRHRMWPGTGAAQHAKPPVCRLRFSPLPSVARIDDGMIRSAHGEEPTHTQQRSLRPDALVVYRWG
jgi:hypothetical protein